MFAAFLALIAPYLDDALAKFLVALLNDAPVAVAAIREANTSTIVDVPALPQDVTDALNQEVQDAIDQGVVPAPDAPLGH